MTVYWVVWDAAAAWIVDRLDAEGALPAVRRLRAAGVRASARPPAPNCQTPAALATLFTGADTGGHGVTGFDLPGGADDPVERQRPGFAPDALARAPVWRAAQEHGLRTAFVHVPWVFPAEGAPRPSPVAAVEAYLGRLAGADLLRLPPPGQARDWPVGPYPLRVRALTSGAELTVSGLDGDARPPVTLDAARGWVPVRCGTASGFWARYLPGPRGPMVVHTGAWRRRVAGTDPGVVDRLRRGAVFAGEGLKDLYRSGALGDRLVDGGDGTAEEVFVSSLGCLARSFGDAVDAVLPAPGDSTADLVVIYLPWTDDAGHHLVGWCDRRSGAYRPDVAAALWAHVRRCYGWSDALLGRVLDRAGAQDTVLLCADHGIVGSSHVVALNQALVAAGLAAARPGGGLDPRASRVLYHPANNGALRVNHDGLPGGLVPRHRGGALLRAAAAALTALPGPPGGRAPVRGFLDRHGRPVDPATVRSDQDVLFVVLDDDYQPTAVVGGGPVVRPMGKSGAHVVNTGTDRLHATFAAAGPGLAAGDDLGVVANTVAAALVRRQLGLPGAGTATAPPAATTTVGTR